MDPSRSLEEEEEGGREGGGQRRRHRKTRRQMPRGNGQIKKKMDRWPFFTCTSFSNFLHILF